MDYSFQRYLLAKMTVDDRALNKDVFAALQAHLPRRPLRILEIGAGIGTMFTRLMGWGLLRQCEYLCLDEMPGNIEYGPDWVSRWAAEAGLQAERTSVNQIHLTDAARDVRVTFECADVFDFIRHPRQKSDLLIAHAVLDLFQLPQGLTQLLSLTDGLAWLTINFDGLTTFEPALEPALDATLERLYHESMDRRPSGGDSRTGRHLFGHLQSAGAELLVAGASDWVVYPVDGRYPADEAYFLHFILHFFEESLTGHPALDAQAFVRWLGERHAQIDGGQLIYIAHQMDFLARIRP